MRLGPTEPPAKPGVLPLNGIKKRSCATGYCCDSILIFFAIFSLLYDIDGRSYFYDGQILMETEINTKVANSNPDESY